jgi:hypothetical protein
LSYQKNILNTQPPAAIRTTSQLNFPPESGIDVAVLTLAALPSLVGGTGATNWNVTPVHPFEVDPNDPSTRR